MSGVTVSAATSGMNSSGTYPEYYFEAEGRWINGWWNTPEDETIPVARARVAPAHDKRATEKQQDWNREMRRPLKHKVS